MVKFQLRFCPALAAKPKEKVPDWSKPKSKADPFADPGLELFISDVPKEKPSHFLVLNKFPVIPNHFILRPRQTYRKQIFWKRLISVRLTLASTPGKKLLGTMRMEDYSLFSTLEITVEQVRFIVIFNFCPVKTCCLAVNQTMVGSS